jgi:hypothetical protein
LSEQITNKIKKFALQAIQEASLEVLYEDENGQAYIPEEKMYKLASKKSKLAISTLKWANENR